MIAKNNTSTEFQDWIVSVTYHVLHTRSIDLDSIIDAYVILSLNYANLQKL